MLIQAVSKDNYETVLIDGTTHTSNDIIYYLDKMLAEIKTSQVRLETNMEAFQLSQVRLEKKMEIFQESTEKKMEALKESMEAKMEALRSSVTDAIGKKAHNFRSDIAATLSNATEPIICKNQLFRTSFSAYYRGRVFVLSVKHSMCANETGYLTCDDNLDIVLYNRCPTTSAVINISESVPLRIGDEASTLGFVLRNGTSHLRFWSSYLTGRYGLNTTATDNVTLIAPNEYIMQATTQLPGMSGGCTCNGCGFTGVVHANDNLSNLMALVIPAADVHKCLDKHLSVLMPSTNCSNLIILSLPKSSGC